MQKTLCLVIILCFNSYRTLQFRNKIECGYKQCPQTRDGALNVHLIPHSHMDAGWVKTFDEYYYGTRTTISTANVQLIYHSVLSELLHDKRRKFTFSETAYFWRWWKEQRPATRATFRTLVQEGRIEFAGGGWVQNDEATLDYMEIIDHFTWGLRKLNDTLGPCGKPRAAWQIDTYGHTREQTSLLAQMGYDGLFIGRVDHKQREAMIEEDRMEFMWRGSDVLGKMSDIMTHTLFNLYNAPDGFCFDFLCSDEPIVDDPDNRAYNAEKRVNEFISQIERQAKYYDHDNIMVTMGGDFTYQSAANWYMNMDKLINHVNTHPANMSDVHIFYSTPSCYLKAIYLYGRRDKAIFTEKDDLLPYGSDPNTYWVGFYTSRPALKYLVRRAHVFLQVVKQLTVIARMGDTFELHLLRHAVNLLLHHDAVTGTSQQHVTNDFVRTLSEAIDACTKKVSSLLSHLTPTWGSRRAKNTQQFVVCHQLNISQCRFTETQESMLLLVYNPHSTKTYYHVCLPANSLHYTIRDFNDEEVEYQLVPLVAAVINLPGRSSTAIQELCFEAENVPPLGYTAFYVAPVQDRLAENEYAKKVQNKQEPEQDPTSTIYNEFIKVTVNRDTGLLESISHVDGVKIDLSQNFYYYSQTAQSHQSGAYSFRTDKSKPTPVTSRVTYHTLKGVLVKEIRQRFTDWITQIIRLYRGEEFVEFEWIIGPVPIGTDLGKEVVTVFHTNITNNGQFYSDSNGRQMLRRTCWNESTTQQQKKPIPACYYPVTSRICIQSQNSSVAMCVLTDRSQGGTSHNTGEIELMVHRRLLTDDGFGLEEPLNEEAYGVGLVVKGKHRVVFGNYRQDVDELSFDERVAALARRWRNEPWVFLTTGDKVSRRRWQNVRNKRYSVLRLRGVPRHVHVVTLEPWKGGAVLLRLENTLEKINTNPTKSDKQDTADDFIAKPSHITVHLRQLFLQHKIKAVRETTLAANQWLDDARQMDWSTRYVYNGADDDILAEDNAEYRDEAKVTKEDSKDTGPYSEEEETNQQKYNHQKQKKSSITPSKRFEYGDRKKRSRQNGDREKRSLNPSLPLPPNINENIINGSFIDKNDKEKPINVTVTKKYVNESVIFNPKFENVTITNAAKFSRVFEMRTVTKPTPKKMNLMELWQKPTRFFANLQPDNTSSEEVASDEDFSANIKKRSSRKRGKDAKKNREPETQVYTNTDDGVTRSIFDMYYRPHTHLKQIAASIEYEGAPKSRRRVKKKMRRFKSNDDYVDRSMEGNTRPEEPQQSEAEQVIPDLPASISRNPRRGHAHKQRERDRQRIRERVRAGEIVYGDEKDRRPRIKYGKKSVGVDVPFFITNERNYRAKKRADERSTEEADDDGETGSRPVRAPPTGRHNEDEDEDNEEDEEYEEYERRDKDEIARDRRQKRSAGDDGPITDASQEQTDQSQPEYIITLRPTQIRTFVIWFEASKSPYVM